LSAYAFWGDSKVLDDRGELIATLFPQLQIRERAIVVSVYLPGTPDGVLFIENQDTYTCACSGELAQTNTCALVFASGFRSSAERIRSRDGALLHFAGAGAARLREHFEAWWFDEQTPPGPCWFWGDLDFAGMQILKSLRSRFGAVAAWRPGYAPMLDTLRAQGGYSSRSGSKGQSDPGSTGCPYADEVLLPAVREHGQLDQERPQTGTLQD
jgi:Wadjet anti plasmid transformation system JetA-like protein